MAKTLENLLVDVLGYSYDSLAESPEELEEKLIIEDVNENQFEISDIFLASNNNGIVFRMGRRRPNLEP